MPPKLRELVALYTAKIAEMDNIEDIYKAIMEIRLYVGNHRFLELEMMPTFVNNNEPALLQSAAIINGDRRQVEKTIASAYDEALLQIIDILQSNDEQTPEN
jgi:hypothetical protein